MTVAKPTGHYSDCAVHNEPLSPNGPCDCGGIILPDGGYDTSVTIRSDKPGALGDFLRDMTRTPAAVPPFPERMEGEGVGVRGTVIRRTARASQRFRAAVEPIAINARERAALRQIELGYVSNAAMRKLLVSKGLITSQIASRCALTPKGKATVAARLSITREPQEG